MPDETAPQSIEAFHRRLQEVTGTLPKRLAQCAEYLAGHSDRIALSTVGELAKAAGVQPSAMMRFCQIMGFSGFSQMQRLFREGYAQVWPDYGTRLRNLGEAGSESPAALLAEFIETSQLSLERLARTFESEALDRAVDALAGARTIHVVGLRRAFAVAAYLDYVFDKMAVPAILHDGLGRLDRRHALMPDDALIAVSFAPYSAETVELAEHAQQRGLPVVAITDTVLSPLNGIGAHVLTVTEADFGAFRGLSATLSLSLALAVATGARRRGSGRPLALPVEME
ncbi:MurR/RpiR family transcriptional regulator [Aurantimonas endophytica]|uniref:DNA-binding MurR/RpiR family transcriptional regulator n=1 Tax=Aurantimonas endophytica TaxID=1522175 RepID=A0A7W6MR15_9HYPH|nr:MurR/RpiR family transcriptional regulator [Aurantimonas endophytica]MBB4004549.1 DNA-binding MurR/RpiR family transcriptional regulator [Aurantimonas endophytica]MCO6405385.1 SIS domain-containing protein [Aurantimonas endophytica]